MNKVIVFAPGWSSLPLPSRNPLLKRFKKHGYATFSISYRNGGRDPISELAKDAKDWVNLLSYDDDEMVFIGHSMGALVGRYMIQKLNYRPSKYISLAGPHHGSPFSKYSPLLWPNSSAADMAPDSPLLESLDRCLWPSEVDPMTMEAMVDLLVPNGRLAVRQQSQTSYSCISPPRPLPVYVANEKIPWTEHLTLLTSQRTFWEAYAFLEYA